MMSNATRLRWLTVVLFLLIVLFVLIAILPLNIASNTIPSRLIVKALFLICSAGVLWFCYKTQSYDLAPFVILFLWALSHIAGMPGYVWGADDADYYSYAPSIILDHDLDLTNQYNATGHALPGKII